MPKADFFIAVKKAFPSIDLNWLITGQGDIWDGSAPKGLEQLEPPTQPILSDQEQAMLNRLLILKLQEVARALKKSDPALLQQLQLEEVLGKDWEE